MKRDTRIAFVVMVIVFGWTGASPAAVGDRGLEALSGSSVVVQAADHEVALSQVQDSCSVNGDCQGWAMCGSRGLCVARTCTLDEDCGFDYECTLGQCGPAEVECNADDHCELGTLCHQGWCVDEESDVLDADPLQQCTSSQECWEGSHCILGRCTEPGRRSGGR